jgi:hypothetical protein
VDVYQCPECPLKFRSPSELDQHLSLDHPEFKSKGKTPEDELLRETHRHHRHRSYNPRKGDNSD